jgi:hypothetical protein
VEVVVLVSPDTTEEAARVQREVYRRMSPARRLQLIFEMNEHLRKLLAAGVRSRHPDYTEAQVKRAVIRLWLGRELFERAYPGQQIVP